MISWPLLYRNAQRAGPECLLATDRSEYHGSALVQLNIRISEKGSDPFSGHDLKIRVDQSSRVTFLPPGPTMNQRINRRSAIQTTFAGAMAVHGAAANPLSAAEGPNDKLNLVCIGVGGRGHANVQGTRSQNLVAFVDVDENRAQKSYAAHRKTQRFTDYRKMFDKIGSQIDAVVISTPDHSHFHPAIAAMQLGLHVYLEKPLAHNVWETRTLTDYARKNNIATQLGAQRHAIPNMHRVVELIQAGAIGKVTDVYSWVGGDRGMPELALDRPAPPASLDYDLWVGPAKFRPYHPTICPYGWRFWWDYGTGETGNWGCHILDIPFWALGLNRELAFHH